MLFLPVRKQWDDYQRAFEEMIEETSTEWAPWVVVPANRKWLRNLMVSQVLIDTLEGLGMQYPDPEPGWESIEIE